MEIVSFKVSQYRSISGEISSDNFNGLTIVGQNNSGKTNLLKAMRVFFEGKFNPDLYDYEKDKPHGVKQGQTSFAVRFTFSESELDDVSEDLSQDDDDDDDDDRYDSNRYDDEDDYADDDFEEEEFDEVREAPLRTVKFDDFNTITDMSLYEDENFESFVMDEEEEDDMVDDLDDLLSERPKERRSHSEKDDTFQVDYIDLD